MSEYEQMSNKIVEFLGSPAKCTYLANILPACESFRLAAKYARLNQHFGLF